MKELLEKAKLALEEFTVPFMTDYPISVVSGKPSKNIGKVETEHRDNEDIELEKAG